jgi:hypothetical protein
MIDPCCRLSDVDLYGNGKNLVSSHRACRTDRPVGGHMGRTVAVVVMPLIVLERVVPCDRRFVDPDLCDGGKNPVG